MSIKKAVIPAAGLGLNFLPTTKATAKEMLPIVDKPVMQFVVEEAEAAGIEEFIIVTGRHKRSIEDHFDANFELEENLAAKGKKDLLKVANETTKDNIYYVRQPSPKGVGDAVLSAKEFVANEPFVVLLADNIMLSDEPVTKQIIDKFDELDSPIVAVQKTDEVEKLASFGVVDIGEEVSDKTYTMDSFVEKPDLDSIQGSYASIGRYVLTPEIFNYLETQEPGKNGQVQLTDAIARMNERVPVYAYDYDGERYDVGDVMGYLEANILSGLNHPDTAEDFKTYLKDLAKELEA